MTHAYRYYILDYSIVFMATVEIYFSVIGLFWYRVETSQVRQWLHGIGRKKVDDFTVPLEG